MYERTPIGSQGRKHTANLPKGGQPNNALAAQALGALESWPLSTNIKIERGQWNRVSYQ
jgi:hypothetical protein